MAGLVKNVLLMVVCLSVVGNANAISHKYRNQLKAHHCTQVQELKGDCPQHAQSNKGKHIYGGYGSHHKGGKFL